MRINFITRHLRFVTNCHVASLFYWDYVLPAKFPREQGIFFSKALVFTTKLNIKSRKYPVAAMKKKHFAFLLFSMFSFVGNVWSQTCIELPSISGTPTVGAAPVGWNLWQITPDIINGNGPWPGGTYTVSDVNGVSSGGGAMGLFLQNGGSAPTGAEGWQTTLTGLVPGNSYTVSCEWQQATLSSGSTTYTEGDLLVTVDGVPTLFTSTGGVNDPWQVASVTFIATGTTALYQVRVSEFSGGPTAFGSCIVIDDYTCTNNFSVALTGGTICEGDCFDLTAVPTNATGSVTYSWDNGIVATNAGPITVCPTTTTTYEVTATDGSGNISTATATVVVDAQVNVDLGADTTLCNVNSLTLDAGNSGATYSWNTNATTQTISVTSSGIYGVEVSSGSCYDSDSINVVFQSVNVDLGPDQTLCNGASTTLDAGNPGLSYSWNDNSSNQTLNVSNSGTYWVTVNDGSCIDSDTIVIDEVNVNVNLGPDTTICLGNSVLLDAGNSGANYLWSDNSTNQQLNVTTSGTYWVEADISGCSDADTIDVNVVSIDVDLGNDTIICLGETVLLDAENPGASYVWNDNSGNQQLNASTAGTYWVTATAPIGCSDSDTIVIDIQQINAAFFAIPTQACAPATIEFTDESNIQGGTITSWEWNFGDGQSSTTQHPDHVYQNAGNYSVSLSLISDIGCTDTLTIPSYIQIFPTPNASIYGPGTVLEGESIQLVNASNASNSWWFMDGDSISGEQHLNYTFYEDGDHDIMLVTMNSYGCLDTAYHTVNVRYAPNIFVPNTFTPDDDEINQTWEYHLTGIDFYDFSIQVYNRWGELVWESTDATESWDGTYKGKLVPDGTYTWIIRYGDYNDGNQYVYNGHVNVIH